MKAAWLLASASASLAIGICGPARADSASVDAISDSGGGSVTVTYTVTSTSGTPGQTVDLGNGPITFGGNYLWYAYLAEEHSSRPCNTQWANYLRDVGTLHETAGSATRTVTFRPFFPRQIKLCVFLRNTAGERAVHEQVVTVPAGYGMQRSSAYNCSHFSRYSAQDYYWLYPGDPSDLDADNDGAACDYTDGNPPGPQIPPEPAPAAPATPTPGTSAPVVTPPPVKTTPKRVATLTRATARSYVRTALRATFGSAYRHATGKDVSNCRRLSRLRFGCRVTFWSGDTSWRGRVTVYRYADGSGWSYSGRIKRTNEYCAATGGRRCSQVVRL